MSGGGGGGMGHRGKESARKLAETLTVRYFERIDPTESHQHNVATWVRPELLQLTGQALATRGRRLPPRVRARLDAFIDNLSHAVPESALPQALARLATRISSNSGSNSGRSSLFGLRKSESLDTGSAAAPTFAEATDEPRDGEASVDDAAATGAGPAASTAGGPSTPETSTRSGSWLSGNSSWADPADADAPVARQPQISVAEMEARLASYITAVWASAAASKAIESAKNDFQGQPEAAKSADAAALEAIHNANANADAARVEATCKNFVSLCHARAALMPRATVLQNLRPRPLLAPLLVDLVKEVLGLPCIDATTEERLDGVLGDYERQHSWWQPIEVNVENVLKGLLDDFVVWLRLNDDAIAANCATEEMLAGIDPELRRRLKSQVYYSADHFMSVFKQFEAALSHLPIPLHPLLDHSIDMDEAQAYKDMLREKFCLNGDSVPPHECPDRVHVAIVASLDRYLAKSKSERARRLARQASTAAAPSPKEAPSTKPAASQTLPPPAPGEESAPAASGDPPSEELPAASDRPSEGPPSTPATTTTDERRSSSTHAPGQDGAQDAGSGGQPCHHAALARHLCMRTIHATSRTASGGDAFFIVQELYGGDGVLVKQSCVTAPPIEIDVASSGITVKSRDSYEVYHEDEVVMATVEALPLMLITTTMTEFIPFPPADVIRSFMHRRPSAMGDSLGHSDAFFDGSDSRDCKRFLKVAPHKPAGREKGRTSSVS